MSSDLKLRRKKNQQKKNHTHTRKEKRRRRRRGRQDRDGVKSQTLTILTTGYRKAKTKSRDPGRESTLDAAPPALPPPLLKAFLAFLWNLSTWQALSNSAFWSVVQLGGRRLHSISLLKPITALLQASWFFFDQAVRSQSAWLMVTLEKENRTWIYNIQTFFF